MTTHGTLALTSPWCRQEFPDYSERRALQESIPAGYTILIHARTNRSGWWVSVMEHGATMFGNRIVLDRRFYRLVREGIDEALDWIADHDTATFAGVEVPVR